MQSYQIIDWGRPLEPREYPTPEPRGSEVLLEITACGVCHSDLHIWQGYFDLGEGRQLRIEDRGLQLPFTLGHEIAGRVVAKGPEATGVEIGDERVAYPWIGCGACAECRRGENLMCLTPRILGTWVNGGYSTHVIVPDPRWLVAHDRIEASLACTYACSGITAYSALKKTGLARADQVVLLIGAGGVGLAGLLMAKALVPGKVLVADIDAGKRQAAMATGQCDAVFDNADAASLAAIRDASGGGVAAVIDFVGRPETTRFGIDALQKGGTLVVVGLYGDLLKLPMPLIPLRVLTIKGSYVGTLDDLKAVIALAQSGKLPPLEVKSCGLDHANDALASLHKGEVTGRMVLRPS
jgi:D-arabinose 1-dehydrogenase-like Zn-dependent alcohol dehydrogenase